MLAGNAFDGIQLWDFRKQSHNGNCSLLMLETMRLCYLFLNCIGMFFFLFKIEFHCCVSVCFD